MRQSTTFLQSRTTHRSLATAPGSLNWKSRISTHIERDLAKLFLDGV